jgi:hypothetical protein
VFFDGLTGKLNRLFCQEEQHVFDRIRILETAACRDSIDLMLEFVRSRNNFRGRLQTVVHPVSSRK